MAIRKGIPTRAPKKLTSTPCINVTLLLSEGLLSRTYLNNTRFRILPVSVVKKKERDVPEIVMTGFGRGKRSASAAITTASTASTRRIVSPVRSNKARKITESTTARSYYNNHNTTSMIRSNSASATHNRLEQQHPSPLARSFSVGLDQEEEEETTLPNLNRSNGSSGSSSSSSLLAKSVTSTGRTISRQPNHLSDYEMAYVP